MTLRKRAELFKAIRCYFDRHNVTEVDTPMLSASATVDLHIESFSTPFKPVGGGREQRCYLHTSPEFPMKRLLAAGSGDIYSLGRVFRNGEAGGRHNPEFALLEYYRLGMDQQQLMDDLSELLKSVADFQEVSRLSYGQIFQTYLKVNPHSAQDDELEALVQQHVDPHLKGLDRNDCLDLLFTTVIEPSLGESSGNQLKGVYVYDYPASMSVLARLRTNKQGEQVAARFELFVNGMELANGYHELTDGNEQKARFEQEQIKRKEQGREMYPYDARLVQALQAGMPDCAGVAMGIDRLLMLLLNKKKIAEVVAFDFFSA
jgi:lysyl-tRNA synthetase class 2